MNDYIEDDEEKFKIKIDKKKLMKWGFILACIVVVVIYIDSIFVKNNKEPLFCLETKVHADKKSKEFTGLGYKVYKYATTEEIYIYEMVSIFTPFDEKRLLELSGGEIKEFDIIGNGVSVESTKRADNKDKYPLGDVIDSTAKLYGFVTPENKEDIKKYDKSFFKKKVLIACLIQEDAEKTEYNIEKITKQDAGVTIKLRINNKYGNKTIKHNYFLIETDKEKFAEQGYNVNIIIEE